MILFLNNFFATLILRVFTLGKIRKFDESILEKKNSFQMSNGILNKI